MKERLKAALKEMQEIAEELQSMESEFVAKKSDWYNRNLMLSHSGLMDDSDFSTKVWDVNHEQLSVHFDSSINSLTCAMKGFLERYEVFEKACATLDGIIANETVKVPDGWKAYKVMYNDKVYAEKQEFYCYAPDVEKAFEFCKKERGGNVLFINGAEEDNI